MKDKRQRREDFAYRVRCVFMVFELRVNTAGLCTDLSAAMDSLLYGYLRVDVSERGWDGEARRVMSDNMYCFCNIVNALGRNGRTVYGRLSLREDMTIATITALVYDFLTTFDSFRPPPYDVDTLATMATLTHLGGLP